MKRMSRRREVVVGGKDAEDAEEMMMMRMMKEGGGRLRRRTFIFVDVLERSTYPYKTNTTQKSTHTQTHHHPKG